MKAPWVSRRAYDLALQELAHLRAQNEHLVAQLVRVGRKSAGLPEVPREPRKLEPMPREVHEWIRSHDSGAMQREMRRQATQRHAAGETWEAIMQDVLPGEPELTDDE